MGDVAKLAVLLVGADLDDDYPLVDIIRVANQRFLEGLEMPERFVVSRKAYIKVFNEALGWPQRCIVTSGYIRVSSPGGHIFIYPEDA